MTMGFFAEGETNETYPNPQPSSWVLGAALTMFTRHANTMVKKLSNKLTTNLALMTVSLMV